MVGIFWRIGNRLLASGCALDDAEAADDWLDYPGGHAEHWDRWQSAGAGWLRRNAFPIAIMATEYDEHPRGRIVYDRRACKFLLYADRRLQSAEVLVEIKTVFGLLAEQVEVLGDPHYR
jgi:hypothetical protein